MTTQRLLIAACNEGKDLPGRTSDRYRESACAADARVLRGAWALEGERRNAVAAAFLLPTKLKASRPSSTAARILATRVPPAVPASGARTR